MKYVIAFDKFTIPDEKVFRIEINEEERRPSRSF